MTCNRHTHPNRKHAVSHDGCMFFLDRSGQVQFVNDVWKFHQALGVQVRLVSGKVDVVFLYNENVEGFGQFQGTLPEAPITNGMWS